MHVITYELFIVINNVAIKQLCDVSSSIIARSE